MPNKHLQDHYYFFSNDSSSSPLIKQVSISKQGEIEIGLSIEERDKNFIKENFPGLVSRTAKQRNSDLIWLVISGVEHINAAIALLKEKKLISHEFYQQFSKTLYKRSEEKTLFESYNPNQELKWNPDFSIFKPPENTNSFKSNDNNNKNVSENELENGFVVMYEEILGTDNKDLLDEQPKPKTCSMM